MSKEQDQHGRNHNSLEEGVFRAVIGHRQRNGILETSEDLEACFQRIGMQLEMRDHDPNEARLPHPGRAATELKRRDSAMRHILKATSSQHAVYKAKQVDGLCNDNAGAGNPRTARLLAEVSRFWTAVTRHRMRQVLQHADDVALAEVPDSRYISGQTVPRATSETAKSSRWRTRGGYPRLLMSCQKSTTVLASGRSIEALEIKLGPLMMLDVAVNALMPWYEPLGGRGQRKDALENWTMNLPKEQGALRILRCQRREEPLTSDDAARRSVTEQGHLNPKKWTLSSYPGYYALSRPEE